MKGQKVRLMYNGIDTREAVDALERNLKALEGVELHGIGLEAAELTYDTHRVKPLDLETAVEKAGGTIRRSERME